MHVHAQQELKTNIKLLVPIKPGIVVIVGILNETLSFALRENDIGATIESS